MEKATFYHAGCPVCQAAENELLAALDHTRFEIEIVNLAEHSERIAEAQRLGVRSVPCVVIDQMPFHINFGASLDSLIHPSGQAQEDYEYYESFYE